MSRILAKVLAPDKNVSRGTDHYIDEIIVNEDIVSVSEVKQHFSKYGLISKEPVSLTCA